MSPPSRSSQNVGNSHQGRANRPGEPLFPLPLRASAGEPLHQSCKSHPKFLSLARLRLKAPSSQRNPSFVPWCLREKTTYDLSEQKARSQSRNPPHIPTIPNRAHTTSIKVVTSTHSAISKQANFVRMRGLTRFAFPPQYLPVRHSLRRRPTNSQSAKYDPNPGKSTMSIKVVTPFRVPCSPG